MSGGQPSVAPTWRARTRQLLDKAINFILPPVCVSCRRPGPLFCSECRHALTWFEEPLCRSCGRFVSTRAETCAACRQQRSPLEQIRAVVTFDGPIREAIHQFKYEGMFGVAPVLAELMAERWPEWRVPVDLVIPVPLHSERKRERGYNQAELLVQFLCRQRDLDYDMEALQRVRHTRPQVGLDWVQRHENVRGAFASDHGRVAGKHVLLVDDVLTTGATMAAAATALLNNGARAVNGYCLARPANAFEGQGQAN